MRLIDADRLLEPRRIGTYYHLPNGDIAIPLIDIEHAPSIDAVQVIRCKDCNHWTTMVERPKHGTCDQWCTLNVTRRDEYCSRAERKES